MGFRFLFAAALAGAGLELPRVCLPSFSKRRAGECGTGTSCARVETGFYSWHPAGTDHTRIPPTHSTLGHTYRSLVRRLFYAAGAALDQALAARSRFISHFGARDASQISRIHRCACALDVRRGLSARLSFACADACGAARVRQSRRVYRKYLSATRSQSATRAASA